MFQDLLVSLSEAFEKTNIPYMVIGGQAVLVYGEPRFTKDIDVTLGAGVERLDDVLKIVGSIGWKVLTPSPAEFVQKTMVLPCQDPASGVRLDLVFSFSPYEHQAMERVRRIKFSGKEVCFASPEDLIIHKVVAGRPRDLEDVRAVQLKNPGMDRGYIEKWLKEFEKTLDRSLLETWKKL
ncbi:MAG TPA: nucleotidyl transferase AbiEii/AbiGii toxin family protein [Puia sp.]|nr:nucleotidyl transferase AbiEii/AbiGii toxin family protein [Puia sp.]